MLTEKHIAEDRKKNLRENMFIAGGKSSEEIKQEVEDEANHKREYLKDLGIELMPNMEKAKMSFEDLLSYSVKKKDEILGIQNNLPPKDFEASRAIFDEIYNDLDLNSKKYCDLRMKYDL